MIIWRIVLSREGFYSFDGACPRVTHFRTREACERVAMEWAAKKWEWAIEERLPGGDLFEDLSGDERAHWAARPALVQHRYGNNTSYFVGHEDWDSRDRRGCFFGSIEAVEVSDE